MRISATDVATATGGTLHGDDVEVSGAAIDSRRVRGGELFVPIVAERDGHVFIPAALAAGAAAYLTASDPVERGEPIEGSAIHVVNTGAALLDLGRLARDRLPVPVIGITGSVGKTTVKDLTAAALGRWVNKAASEQSFNNELGVPLTLLNAADTVDVAVIEMGSRGRGHIKALCEVARPTIGVVTAVAAAHTETFGTVEEVALAKAELVEALPAAGTAILNGDQSLVLAMSGRTAAEVLVYGTRAGCDVVASDIELDERLRARFRADTPWGHADVRVPIAGRHQVGNALAALSAALAFGTELPSAVEELAQARVSPWRMDLRTSPSGAVVLNDAYNANPASMDAALRSLAALDVPGRRVAVLGLMAELGPLGDVAHRTVAATADALGIEVIAVGTAAYGRAPMEDLDAVLAVLDGLGDGDAVLVKGSRVAGLERVAAALLEESASQPRAAGTVDAP